MVETDRPIGTYDMFNGGGINFITETVNGGYNSDNTTWHLKLQFC